MSSIEPGPLTLEIPLRQDSTGAIRIGTSRVLLDLVIRAFQEGETPEAIVQSYDTLNLADVYAVLGYYLAHTDAIQDYLRRRDTAAAETRHQIESAQPARANLREILLTRDSAMERPRAPIAQ